MRGVLALAAALFAVGLAGAVAPLLGSEGRALAVGVVIGFLASLPTVLALFALLRRERARTDAGPRIMVVPPPADARSLVEWRP